MYIISSTYIVILELITLTTLEIWQGERALLSGSRFSKTQCLGQPNFSVYTFARSIEEMSFRRLRWITGRKNDLKWLVRSNIYPKYLQKYRRVLSECPPSFIHPPPPYFSTSKELVS